MLLNIATASKKAQKKGQNTRNMQKPSTHHAEGRDRTRDLLHSGLYLPETRVDRGWPSTPDAGQYAANKYINKIVYMPECSRNVAVYEQGNVKIVCFLLVGFFRNPTSKKETSCVGLFIHSHILVHNGILTCQVSPLLSRCSAMCICTCAP